MSALFEAFFLPLANNLPKFKVFDKIRIHLLRLAGIKIGSRATVWGPLTIRPYGKAFNIQIGDFSFLNTETRFGVPEEPPVSK